MWPGTPVQQLTVGVDVVGAGAGSSSSSLRRGSSGSASGSGSGGGVRWSAGAAGNKASGGREAELLATITNLKAALEKAMACSTPITRHVQVCGGGRLRAGE